MASADGYKRVPRGVLSDPGGVVIYNPETLETTDNLRWNSETNTLIIDGTIQAGDIVYSFTDLEQQIADATQLANDAIDTADVALTRSNDAIAAATGAAQDLSAHVNDEAQHVGVLTSGSYTVSTAPSGYKIGASMGSSDNTFPDFNATIATFRPSATRAMQFVGGIGANGLWARVITGSQTWSSWREFLTLQKHIDDAATTATDRLWSVNRIRNYALNKSGDTMTGQLIVPSIRSDAAILTGATVDGGKRYLEITPTTSNSAGLRITSNSFNAELSLNSGAGTTNYLFQSSQAGNLTISESVGGKTFFTYDKAADRISLAGDVSINGTRVGTTGVDSFTSDQLPSSYNVGYTLGGGDATMPFTAGTLFTARSNTSRGLQLLASKASTSFLVRSINTVDDWAPWRELMQEEKHIVNTSATATNRVWSSQQTKTYADSLINNTSSVSTANAWSSQQTKTYVDNAISGAAPVDARRIYYYRAIYTHNGVSFTYEYEPVFTTNVRNNGVGFGNLTIGTENGIQFFDLTCTRPAGLPGASAPVYILNIEDWKGEFANTLLVPQILMRSPSGSVKFALRNASGNYVALTKPFNRETYTYEVVISLVLDWNY